MTITAFPPIEAANEYGLLAIGGDLEVPSLLLAYSSGIFPWPVSARREIPWFCPPTRAVLYFKDFNFNRTLQKEVKQQNFTFSIDQEFESIIGHCANIPRAHENSTWITPQMIKSYVEFHQAGYAHSVECYQNGKICGGLYGVSVGKMFAGESMFHLQPNASKLSLWHLVQYLQSKGLEWIDCQNMTPFLESMGATEISREAFLELLEPAVAQQVKLF